MFTGKHWPSFRYSLAQSLLLVNKQLDDNIIPTTMTPPPPPSPPPQPLVQHFCQLQTILVFTPLKLILEIETNIDEYFRHDYWVLLRSWSVMTILSSNLLTMFSPVYYFKLFITGKMTTYSLPTYPTRNAIRCSASTQRAPAIVQPSTNMYFGTPAVIQSATNICFGKSWPFCPATNMSLPPTFYSETTLNSPRTLGTSGRSLAASPGVLVSCSLETPFASNSPRTLSTLGRSFAAPPGYLSLALSRHHLLPTVLVLLAPRGALILRQTLAVVRPAIIIFFGKH